MYRQNADAGAEQTLTGIPILIGTTRCSAMAGHWIYPRSLDLRLPQRHGLRLWLRLRRWQGKPFGCWQGKLFGRWQGELLRGWQSTLLRWRTSASRCSALFCLQLCVHPSLHQAFVRGPRILQNIKSLKILSLFARRCESPGGKPRRRRRSRRHVTKKFVTCHEKIRDMSRKNS